jgi:Protein of unknown function (DUF4232)
MSSKTLTDELRSVLLFHSLEAPQPNATVDRILDDTVGSVVALGTAATSGTAATAGTGGSAKAPRRMSVQQLVAASVVAVLLLAVAGINSVRNRDTARTASPGTRNQVNQPASGYAANGSMALPEASDSVVPDSAGSGSAGSGSAGSGSAGSGSAGSGSAGSGSAVSGTAAKAGPAHPPAYSGKGLDCSTLPGGGRLMTGQWDNYTLNTGETGYLYEFLCVGQNGQRSASEIQVFRQAGGKLQYKQTLLRAAAGQHVDFLTAGTDTVRIQASVQASVQPSFHSTASGGVPGEVISTAWDLSEVDPGQGFSFTVANPCLPTELTAAVTEVPDAAAPSWRLTLRNDSDTACALEGYPQVRAQRAGTTLTTAVHTLSGTAGGLTHTLVPPIIVLSPQATAAAIIEQSAASAAGSCPRSDQLAVTLPNGVSLGLLPARLAGCGLAVHPLVGNVRGSD